MQLQSVNALEKLINEMEKVVIGRNKTFKKLFAALITGGHVLFEDLPGIGKTTMVKAFARGLQCDFSRIQCTPDLLPSDILGASIFNPKTNEFELRKGPVFTNVLLVDEINRALPRTQSSLLECMEEGQVTIEGETFALSKPFIVLATQNPVDSEGTFPLPEAQMDRFLMKIKLGYPSLEEEEKMLLQVGDTIPYEEITGVFTPEELRILQSESEKVQINKSIVNYIARLAKETRAHRFVTVGVSPRASKALYKAVKAWAFIHHRSYVTPDDVKDMLIAVWGHRLLLTTEARMKEMNTERILEEIMSSVDVPKETGLQ